ncbi:MAG: peptide chain release factor 2 [Nitrospirota bacterium]
MVLDERVKELTELKENFNLLRGIFDVAGKERRLNELRQLIESPDFWTDIQKTQTTLKEKSDLESLLKRLHDSETKLNDLEVMIALSREEEGDPFGSEIARTIDIVKSEIESLRIETLLSEKRDINNAIVTIHPGAGGTESQDWAEMLLRMYLKWAEMHGFKTEIIDLLSGEEAGIKSVTFTVTGKYAYGYLKAEAGIHRLVRISPFDANKRRHTSFTSVFVYPEIEEDIKVDLRDDDLRIETFRASGAGGQHVNKTSSAVRITHIPTGITVQCQNERSQHKNKATALRVLKSRVYEFQKKEKEKELEQMLSEKKEIAWGSQIRSYIMQPYQMVKDHRTGVEVGNVDAVLNGEIDQFIESHLLKTVKSEK